MRLQEVCPNAEGNGSFNMWCSGPYQVGLSIKGNHKIAESMAKAVSLALGGNGELWLVDSGDDWNLWTIDLPAPYDGTIKVVDKSGLSHTVDVETPLP